MSADNLTLKPLEQQFEGLRSIITYHRSRASQAVNEQQLLTAWNVGAYVSHKLKTNAPDVKGFSRRNIYNMVMFYDEYSSPAFISTVNSFFPNAFVQLPSAQIQDADFVEVGNTNEIVQMPSAQFEPMSVGQLPEILKQTSYSNHIAILNQCKNSDERLFYILYAHRERLKYKEIQRCISTDTYTTLLGSKHNLSKGLLETYPAAPILFKDTAFVDFLGLPQKHSEKKLRVGLVEHMKQFILELGKDFLFVNQEYSLEVGASTFKADLLFFHRGLQALVAVELKRHKFHPKDLGQLEFYLEALDRDVKRTNENPSIGIILCPEADKTVVEYAMSRSMSPTMVAEYKRQLIPKEKMQQLLREYCDLVQIEKGGSND